MDNVMDTQLPQLYFEWVKELRIAAKDEERGPMEEFWFKLMMDIKMQMEEIRRRGAGWKNDTEGTAMAGRKS